MGLAVGEGRQDHRRRPERARPGEAQGALRRVREGGEHGAADLDGDRAPVLLGDEQAPAQRPQHPPLALERLGRPLARQLGARESRIDQLSCDPPAARLGPSALGAGGRVTLPLATRAPAKVNLTLHVLGRRADGYHALESLVAFAGVGDSIALTPGDALDLVAEGETADRTGPAESNLVVKAARALAERIDGLRWGAFRLVKRLPVAAGLGGGSSDAAAALRLLARLNGLPLRHPALREAACATGADVPVCLEARARMMTGAG